MIKKGLIALLENDTPVATVVGSRIHVETLPQDLDKSIDLYAPCLLLRTISTDRIYSNDGNAGCPTASIDVDCFATTYASVIDLADKVRLAIDGYRGTSAGQTIHGIFLTNQSDNSGNVEPGAEVKVRRITLTFEVHFVESV